MELEQIGISSRLSREERTNLERSLVEARKHYDGIIARLNADNLAAALPEDLLVEIFKSYVSTWRERDPFNISYMESGRNITLVSENNAGAYGWITVTRVCRRWRAIAVRTPGLWTRIRVSSLSHVEKLIKRSGNMPLEVEGVLDEGQHGEMSNAWRRIFAESARIAGLKLTYQFVSEGSEGVKWIKSARVDFPVLKALFVAVHRMSPGPVPLPPILDRLHNPSTSLTTFYAYGVDNLAISKLLQAHGQLRHLELQNTFDGRADPDRQPSPDDALLDWQELLTLLQSVPLLQSLRLLNASPHELSDILEEFEDFELTLVEIPLLLDRPVPLPHLSFFHMRDDWPDDTLRVALLLHNIVHPPALSMNITSTAWETTGTPRDLLRVRNLLNDRLLAWSTASPTSPCRKLKVHSKSTGYGLGGEHDTTIEGWKEELPHPLLQGPTQYPCSSEAPRIPQSNLFTVTCLSSSIDDIFYYVISSLDLQMVWDLSLSTTPLWRKKALKHVQICHFKTLTQVKSLSVSYGWLLHLPHLLEPLDTRGNAVFPELDTLRLGEIGEVDVDKWKPWGAPNQQRKWMQKLQDAFKARFAYTNGKRLKKISVGLSRGVTAADIEELKAYADDVTWLGPADGLVDSDETSCEDNGSE